MTQWLLLCYGQEGNGCILIGDASGVEGLRRATPCLISGWRPRSNDCTFGLPNQLLGMIGTIPCVADVSFAACSWSFRPAHEDPMVQRGKSREGLLECVWISTSIIFSTLHLRDAVPIVK